MKELFLTIAILVSNIANSQMIKENFETTHPKVKVVEVKSNKLEMGYQDKYNSESDHFGYKVNGVYIKYDNERWFIPFNRIQSIDSKEEIALIINLKVERYNLEKIND